MYTQPPYGHVPQQPGMPPPWPGAMAQQPKRRVSGCIKALIIVAVGTVVLVGSCAFLVFKHPRVVLRFFGMQPEEFALVEAVADGRTVHVLYHNESFIPVMTKMGDESELELPALAFHGTVTGESWTDVEPVLPFSSAIWFHDALWVFDDGGCRRLVDGQWRTVMSDTEWGAPVARMIGDKLCVFYVDASNTLHVATSADGLEWTPGKLERRLPERFWPEDVRIHFEDKVHPPFRVAVLHSHPYVFWYDWGAAALGCIYFNRGWTEAQVEEAGTEFDVVADDERLYLFELGNFRQGQDLRTEPATVNLRTFNGISWSDDQDLGFLSTGCISAERVGDDIWLFTSENHRLVYRVLSNGRWSSPNEVPKPEDPWERPEAVD